MLNLQNSISLQSLKIEFFIGGMLVDNEEVVFQASKDET